MRIADTLSIGILNAHCGNKNTLVATPDRGLFYLYTVHYPCTCVRSTTLDVNPFVHSHRVIFQLRATGVEQSPSARNTRSGKKTSASIQT